MTHFRIVRVRVEIVDVNDNRPTFPRPAINLAVPETAAVGTSLHLPAAHDADSGLNGQLRYVTMTSPAQATMTSRVRYVTMTSAAGKNVFQLVERSRSDIRLVLTSPLDRETTDKYQLMVIAEDGGEPPQSGSIQVITSAPAAGCNQ